MSGKFIKILFFSELIFLLAAYVPLHAQIVDGDVIMDQPMNENLCALTFDDGPARYTEELLDMLAQYHIPATFFLLGQQAAAYPDLVARMIDEGHEVGNHSWSHPNLKKLSASAQTEQIVRTDALLRRLGTAPLFMRPPYGSFDDTTVRIAKNLGLSIMLWSMDSKDWKKLPSNYARILSTRGTVYEDGQLRGIFLFHDIHKNTVDDLPRILAQLKAGGCERFVTVSEYLQGLADPEAGLRMSRRGESSKLADNISVNEALKYAAGSGPLPLARCSEPWRNEHAASLTDTAIKLEDAHAAAGGRVVGHP